MTDLASATADAVLDLLNNVGAAATLRKLTIGTGPNPTTTTSDYAGIAVTSSSTVRDMTGTLIKNNQRNVLLRATGSDGNPLPEPMVKDRMLVAGDLFTITQISHVVRGAQIVAFRLLIQ